jgi:enoyl-CoA hydratase/carnithine racemase
MSIGPEYETLTVALDGPRGEIRLNRPEKLNALSVTTLRELAEAARYCDSRPEVKVVVIAGAGRSFCAGADVTTMASPSEPNEPAAPSSAHPTSEAGPRMAAVVEGMRAVTVARLQGHCVGGGVVLACACDLRVAAEDARFSIPELFLGIPLTWGGIPRLVRDVGPAMTKELVMTGRTFGATEARAMGLVNRVVPEGALDEEIERLVGSLLDKSTFTLSATKRHVNAVAEQMVGLSRTWNDTHSIEAALNDAESRAVRASYLERFRAGH